MTFVLIIWCTEVTLVHRYAARARLVVKITKPKWISTFGCPSLTCDQSSLSVILLLCTQWVELFSEGAFRFYNIGAESICAHYPNLSGQPDIFLGSVTFKKFGTLLFAKSRLQKTGSLLIKKRRDKAASSLFG